MLAIESLKRQEGWVSPGFLFGYNLLPETYVKRLENFDFSVCEDVPYFATRRGITTHPNDQSPLGRLVLDQLGDLVSYLNNTDLLCTLTERAFEGDQIYRLNHFWSHGVDSIRRLHSGMIIHLVEDSKGFSIKPHVDHKEIIANLQVYLGPEGYDVGTTFHQKFVLDDTRKVPFARNAGYFSVNTDSAVHSIVNEYDIKRRSLIIGWTL